VVHAVPVSRFFRQRESEEVWLVEITGVGRGGTRVYEHGLAAGLWNRGGVTAKFRDVHAGDDIQVFRCLRLACLVQVLLDGDDRQ
jgi:hypothetical protein